MNRLAGSFSLRKILISSSMQTYIKKFEFYTPRNKNQDHNLSIDN